MELAITHARVMANAGQDVDGNHVVTARVADSERGFAFEKVIATFGNTIDAERVASYIRYSFFGEFTFVRITEENGTFSMEANSAEGNSTSKLSAINAFGQDIVSVSREGEGIKVGREFTI